MPQSLTRVIWSWFAGLLLFSGCSHEGTIVRKEFVPSPFYGSLGIRGLYRFEVRCRDGEIRRQVVSADVFANYGPGDYFVDRSQRLSSPEAPAEGPTPAVTTPFMIALALRPVEQYGSRFPSIPTAWIEPAASPSHDHIGEPGRVPSGGEESERRSGN